MPNPTLSLKELEEKLQLKRETLQSWEFIDTKAKQEFLYSIFGGYSSKERTKKIVALKSEINSLQIEIEQRQTPHEAKEPSTIVSNPRPSRKIG